MLVSAAKCFDSASRKSWSQDSCDFPTSIVNIGYITFEFLMVFAGGDWRLVGANELSDDFLDSLS